jgi:transcriptional regulator with XRE-family HTH domain
MLTPFGKVLRQLRTKYDMRLLDLANALGVSSAYVSAVETGRKPIPDGFVAQVGRAMPIDADELRLVRRAADRTKKEIKVDSLRDEQRELLAAFARKLDDVPDALMDELKKIVLKSSARDAPFRRMRRGFVVKAASAATLRAFAEKVRSIFASESEIAFPIIPLLEFKLPKVFPDFVLDVRDMEEMGDLEGTVVAGGHVLALRSDVYEGACRNIGRHRFTAAHELAHYLLHRDITMARTRDDDVPIYRDSEWQADTFAGALMMSTRHLHLLRDAEHAAKECGMSGAAAGHQWRIYENERSRS